MIQELWEVLGVWLKLYRVWIPRNVLNDLFGGFDDATVELYYDLILQRCMLEPPQRHTAQGCGGSLLVKPYAQRLQVRGEFCFKRTRGRTQNTSSGCGICVFTQQLYKYCWCLLVLLFRRFEDDHYGRVSV